MDRTPTPKNTRLTRRSFLRNSVAAAAVSVSASALADAAAKEHVLPRRPLGKTGASVTILNLGCGKAPSPRMMSAMMKEGLRYFDVADCYNGGASEKAVGQWLKDNGRRKDFFIVSKDHPNTPDEWVSMIDKRLEALQTDYMDLFFIHGLGGGFGSLDERVRDWPKAKEWADAADKMKKAGKIRGAGFSTHTAMPLRVELLNNAAKGGWVDAIMVAYDPQSVRDSDDFNNALDACHKANIGLISMKEMRGVEHVPKFMPEYKELGMTPHQAVLHSVWSDDRFSSICSEMPNLSILKENAEAARTFKPLDEKKTGMVLELYDKYATAFCNGCDGRCQKAGCTEAALGDIVRYLAYYERDGMYDEARSLFAKLPPEMRDWKNADLAAAQGACLRNLDFAGLLDRAGAKLA